MKEAMFSVIGNRYAEQLGYQHLIGAYAIVIEQMKALCRVMVVSAKDAKLIGQEADVHKQDLEIEREIGANEYAVLIDIRFDEIIYSQDKELINYFISHNIGKFFLRFPSVYEISEIIDITSADYPETYFKMYNLDEPEKDGKYTDLVGRYHELQKARRDGAAAMRKLEEVKANLAAAGIHIIKKPVEPSQLLTDILRKQIEEQMGQQMETIEPLDMTKLESHGVDRDEDDHDKPGGWGKFWKH